MSDQKEVVPLAAVPAKICEESGAAACIVLVSDERGVTTLAMHGVNHAQANDMLSLGIHMNLTQHDELILAGAAGKEAQELAASLKEPSHVS